jgi:hypothetical protein
MGLHLGDGSLPSGNSAGIRMKRKLDPGYQSQPLSHTANPLAGNRCPWVSE